MGDTKRKKFKQPEEDYKKRLIDQASLGKLSLEEKEQYEILMKSIRKMDIARKQKIIAFFIVLVLIGTIIFLKYGGERWFNINVSQQQVTYYEIPKLSDKNNKELSQGLLMHVEKNDEANMIYNIALKQYNEKCYIDSHYITELENIRAFNDEICLNDINTLFKEIRDKQIIILNALNSKEKSISEINIMIEETRKLNEAYNESVICVLQCEDTECKCILDCNTLHK
ncbi:hypothetical protein [Cellulosilyticum sp. I15G10I2]|uniref:hypothetical protein n=1 Tax=Cellulosilyticum sp. I15G10I2 TaxID=1892843 RepID=UPI00085C4F30|nr:hypothetical protein [Cellulosilyticum sp. I15G10I2]